MRLLPLQWAAIVLIVLDASIVVFTTTGEPALPQWWNFAAVPASAALGVLMLVRSRASLQVGLWTSVRHLRESLPMWALTLAALAFCGGWIIGISTSSARSELGDLNYENGQYTATRKHKPVKVLTEEQYDAAQAADQRTYSAFGLAIAGGVLGFAGVVRRIEETG